MSLLPIILVIVFPFAFKAKSDVSVRHDSLPRDDLCCTAPEVDDSPGDERPKRMAFILGAQKSGISGYATVTLPKSTSESNVTFAWDNCVSVRMGSP